MKDLDSHLYHKMKSLFSQEFLLKPESNISEAYIHVVYRDIAYLCEIGRIISRDVMSLITFEKVAVPLVEVVPWFSTVKKVSVPSPFAPVPTRR